MVSWTPLMYQMSLIDDVEYKNMNEIAWRAYRTAEQKDWEAVLDEWNELIVLPFTLVPSLSMYSIIDLSRPYKGHMKKRSTTGKIGLRYQF